ncbi:MAG: M90 family metallopeptidase, partial [Planctomycetota bacterium]
MVWKMSGVIGLPLLLVVGWFLLVALRRRRRAARRREVLAEPFPAEWVEILRRNVRLYDLLPDGLREELHGHVQVFLDEKVFVGCAGLEMTDEIRVTVAAQACVLLLGREARYYPRLSTIYVYPGAYVAESGRAAGGGGVIVEDQVRLGESWQGGPLVLSWDDVQHGAGDVRDGHNVVLHEFAHKLDQEDGDADGAPILERRSSYVSWARVLSEEYAELRQRATFGWRTVLDMYGATNPAEFFAVLAEAYF